MTALEPPLASVSEARRSVLTALKRHGPMHAADLAAEVGVTVAAVRRQLGRLEEDGLVVSRAEAADGRGRPAHRYELTPTAESLFPKRYGDLTTELLGYLGGPESEEISELFERRRIRRVDGAKARLAGLAPDEQVAELARILDEDGYLADLERMDDGGWRIIEHNCAILSVASGYRQACSSEIGFIREALPGRRVERVAHIMDGAHVCSYEIHEESA
jgi:predicted ArsR family transcriptional regulator